MFKKHMLNTGVSRSRKANEAKMRLFNVCSKPSTCKFVPPKFLENEEYQSRSEGEETQTLFK